jgi:putative ABC transport system substrate-binding protein
MRRREFIALFGGGVAGWPLATRAQQAGRLPTIGFLGGTTPSGQSEWTAAFVQRLRELGWLDGRNVAIEYRWMEGHTERAAEVAAELVSLRVDVIVTSGTAPVLAMKGVTAIPIVFAAAADPVGNKLVASLSRPGGNVTGLSIQQTDLGPKRLEFLREVVPGLGRLAIMAGAGSPGALAEMGEVEAAAGRLGLQPSTFVIRRAEDIAAAFEAFKGRVEGLYVVTDGLLNTNRIRISTLAVAARLATICNYREYVEAGCLLSYGPNVADLYRRAADFVDKILRGTKAGDIPVEQPTKFDLVINLTTAKALGLTIPESFLLRADKVIE